MDRSRHSDHRSPTRTVPPTPSGLPAKPKNYLSPTISSKTKIVPPTLLPPSPPRSPKKRIPSNGSTCTKPSSRRSSRPEVEVASKVSRCWEAEPERGRKRYRPFDLIDSHHDDQFDGDHHAFGYDDASEYSIRTNALPPPWSSYNFDLPPHEPPFPSPPLTPISDISSWSSSDSVCSDLSVSSSTSSLALGPSAMNGSYHQQLSSPPRSPEPPFTAPQAALTRHLIAGVAVYIANQAALFGADLLLPQGTGYWGRACIQASSVLSCEIAMISLWGLERVDRRAKRAGGRGGMAAAEKTWRRRWANVEAGLGWAVTFVIAMTVLGTVVMALASLASSFLPLVGHECTCAATR